ncbi:hypothetical protein [Sphingomonas sp.]|nr:hypothetical protein [Sphingomonas sp.]MBO9714693.1 hypothetical protein [Sphingomonas sp.]
MAEPIAKLSPAATLLLPPQRIILCRMEVDPDSRPDLGDLHDAIREGRRH